jgi:hypothetical protein
VSRRVELGLEGGGVLLLTVEDDDADALRGALGGSGFHEVASDEGENAIDLSKVTYMRVLPGDASNRIGFGGA